MKRKLIILGFGKKKAEIEKRAQIYFGDEWKSNHAHKKVYGIILGKNIAQFFRNKLGFPIYSLDYCKDPSEAWEWHRLLGDCIDIDHNKIKLDSFAKFKSVINKLKKNKYDKVYIFGTGPSLSIAKNRKWDRGYRIVCNTIVKDKQLWNHIKPNFIVAGDAVYHFGPSSFAKAFRKDLYNRLLTSQTYFMYPDIFHPFISREFSKIADKLIPIPGSSNHGIPNLMKDFRLPNNENVLGLLQLPLARTLSKNIYLWGFDGRSPSDSGFWANSPSHIYKLLFSTLESSHPAFFNYHVPANNPSLYADRVQGDKLETLLSSGEKLGLRFKMMHHSWSYPLNKRYVEEKL